MISNKRIKILNEEGQALVEFALFLPFMLMMYSIIMNVSNAINASINQQKVTRSYFYYRMQNNSTIPKPRRSGGDPSQNWSTFGMQIIGWASELYGGETPVAACFKFNLPLGSSDGDKCKDGYSERTTQYIRVGTVYGVCGATYTTNNNGKIRLPGDGIPGVSVVNANSCLLQ